MVSEIWKDKNVFSQKLLNKRQRVLSTLSLYDFCLREFIDL